ncbi:phosphoribosylaminoimidazole-succinocarboxamide synthase [Nitrosomonas stercoris]|uniref:Phosphoribosylaminoimidazole-succinocarboxamide synthase n=1 Tax=Nitrosomonas stercoris TaxID=1444684 RepID=A0A4Y1YNI3_9PROT|nr:phosphoribosylaminoimidazole-succinocarboxamide synthase [Nitrosomonas stercoris]
MTDTPLFETSITSLPLLHRGKVRDIYAVDDNHLLIIQTDRLSAFDVVLPTPVPGKGKILTKISRFWFDKLATIIPNHLTDISPEAVVAPTEQTQVAERAFVVKKLKPLPIEAIVRGYIAGSGWKDYQHTGTICGIALPTGLREADRLPDGAIFTPSTKAAIGSHDENIAYDICEQMLGKSLASAVRQHATALYSAAADYALTRNIIIADTKFEFGLDDANQLFLIDEVLTPDSSRFWPAENYQPGSSPPSYDKQFVRDWLERTGWNKTPPAPAIPAEILAQTIAKYQEAYQTLTQ